MRLVDVGWEGEARSPSQRFDLTIARGSRIVVMGPNGSGKSRLLAWVAGTSTPTSGRRTSAPGAAVAFVRQDEDATPRSTVRRWIEEALRPVDMARGEMHRLEQSLEQGRTDLIEYERAVTRFETLGGWTAHGEAERVARQILGHDDLDVDPMSCTVAVRRSLSVALALGSRSDLIVLDEPTNDLDADAREDLARRLLRAPAHAALVVATHDVALARRVASEVVTLSDRGHRRLHRRPSLPPAPTPKARRPVGPAGRDATIVAPVGRVRQLTHEEWSSPLSFDVRRGERIALLDGRTNDRAHAAAWDALAGRPSSIDAGVVEWSRGIRLFVADRATRGVSAGSAFAQWTSWVTETRAASLGAWVGLDPGRWHAAPEQLSRGERARAGLATCVAMEPDVVLLDHPEADLDVDALERLTATLAGEAWTIIVRTCDPGLAEAIAADVWTVDARRWTAWNGGVVGWRKGRGRPIGQVEDGATPHDPPPGGASGAAVELRDTLEHLEGTMEALRGIVDGTVEATARDRARATARLRTAESEWLEAYDRTLTAPAPRFEVVETSGVRLRADVDAAGTVTFHCDGWPSVPQVRRDSDVAHLVLPEPLDGAWTTWARRDALRAAATIVAVALGPRWVQTPDDGRTVLPPPFVRLDDRWWIASAWALWHDRDEAATAATGGGTVAAAWT